jgi:hypothetical protein
VYRLLLVLSLDVFVGLSDQAPLADERSVLLFIRAGDLVGLDEQLGVQIDVVLMHVVDFRHWDGVDAVIVAALVRKIGLRLGVAVGEKLEAVADAVVMNDIFVAKRQCHLLGWIVLTDENGKGRAGVGTEISEALVTP